MDDSAMDDSDMTSYDSILLVGFGGPEGLDDVLPFMKRVTAGRDIPEARLIEVSAHYDHFDGVSPINAQLRQLRTALELELNENGIRLPVFWGNRNWHPLLTDTVQEMADAGHKKALAVVTSAFSSYSGCRQYLDNIEQARTSVGEAAPTIDKIRNYWNHPSFIEAQVSQVAAALTATSDARLLFTAHSLPLKMANSSDYVEQLLEAVSLVRAAVGHDEADLVYQSRSGPPQAPWLEPDINAHLKKLAEDGTREVVIVPIGFVSDHMEILWDLDTQARETAQACDIRLTLAKTVGTHPRFVAGLRELIQERLEGSDTEPIFVGTLGPLSDICPHDCCPG